MPNPITRREALLAPAALTLDGAAKPAASVTIGMATTEFRDYTNARMAQELKANGLRVIQLFLTQSDSNYWKYNSRSDLAGLTRERCSEIAGIYRSAGISIHSIGVYTNLIHPDPAERKANLAYFDAMMTAGAHMGVRKFISEAGHWRGNEPEPPIPYHWQEEVWRQMLGTAKELARIADSHDATVLLEPYFQGFLASARRTRFFIEEVGSPRIRALLDPANLLEVDSLEAMFDELGPLLDCFHAKDRKLHVTRGVPAGEGDLDYRKFVTLAAERKPGAPLFLEYVGSKNYKQALAHLRGVLRAAARTEWSRQ